MDTIVPYINLIKNTTVFKDVIHNSIKVSDIAKTIIDTDIFQRLRHLHQLGCSFFVFPNANGTRFEHSIGTYHLAKTFVNNLINNSNHTEINKEILKIPYIKHYLFNKLHNIDADDALKMEILLGMSYCLLDEYLVELISIAGLVHDLGHGPFSHSFDNWLEKNNPNKKSIYNVHENRSIYLLKRIIKNEENIIISNFGNEIQEIKLSDIIDDNAIDFISSLIHPSSENIGFIYQIISNNLNGLDVDKLDYLVRDGYYLGINKPFNIENIINNAKVIDSNISFHKSAAIHDIYNMYDTRYKFHKQFYNNKTTVKIEHMVCKLFDNLNKIINIIDKINNGNIDILITLNESFVLGAGNIYKSIDILNEKYKTEIENMEKISKNIIKRNSIICIYEGIETSSSSKKSILEIIDNKIKIHETINNFEIDQTRIIKFIKKIGWNGGDSHPADNLYLYGSNNQSYKSNKNDISLLVPKNCQEYLICVFYDTCN